MPCDALVAVPVPMFVLPVPVLTYRMKPTAKTVRGYVAGIHADCRYSPFILQAIIPGKASIRDGDNEYFISFYICLTGRTYLAVSAVDVVPEPVLST